MQDDDEIIESYEQELAEEPVPQRSNRGFWLVAGTIALAGIFMVGEILANRPLKDTIGHAQQSLRTAQAAAETIHGRTGSFADADPEGLAQEETSLRYLGQDEPSEGLEAVSVAAGVTGWAAAVQARPGACFYLRLTSGGEVAYGVGTTCTGTAALAASDPRW